MDQQDIVLLKVPSLSSSAQSTPEKNGHSNYGSRSQEVLHDFVKLVTPNELVQNCSDQVMINSASCRGMMKEHPKATNRTTKRQDLRKGSNSPSTQISSKKQNRKGENPSRLLPNVEQPSDFGRSKTWICKNSACRAVLSMEDAFCKRCSCCICHLFDDNKDPSLWLVCSSESGSEDSCGLSCHIECALQLEKVGVVDLGQLMRLDGSYCCASCGKVSGIIGNLKKQLIIAKDARRLDVLCYRIYLSYRLLDGTSRFNELYEIVKDAKAKLETEVGPVNGVSAKMARGIVSRLSVAAAVQELCSLGIEKADKWLVAVSEKSSSCRDDSLPAACKFIFEEVTASSVTIILTELSKLLPDEIKGYKLWYSKSGERTRGEDAVCTFPRDQRRIKITHLQPCTQYTFWIMSYTESGDLGHSEAKCFTKSIEIIPKNCKLSLPTTTVKVEPEKSPVGPPGFKVRDLAKVLNHGWTQEQQCYLEESLQNNRCEVRPGISHEPENEIRDQLPDLNEELTPPFDSSPDEDTTSHDEEKNNLIGSHGSRESLTWTGGEVSAVDSHREESRKRSADEIETHDCNSTLIDGSPAALDSDSSGGLDENFECCVKIIRWLECERHINHEFRLRLLTWFSLRSTEQERRIVNTFIQTMIDDPVSLAGQLVDSFSDMLSCRRPRIGTSSDKLWHE